MLQAAESSDAATLRFRKDQRNSGVSRRGRLKPGGRLRIEYDPARLAAIAEVGSPTTDILCHVRFQPSGEHRSGSVQEQSHGRLGEPASARPTTFEVRIPPGTTGLELWFEGCGPAGTTGWDSRYGQNYSLRVAAEGLVIPERSVPPRPDASVDLDRIRVVADAASKEQATIGTSGKRLLTELVVHARIGRRSGPTAVSADVHVFDATGDLIQSATVELQQTGSDRGFRVRDDVYQGSGGGSGVGVWSRPDAHLVQYRIYCQSGHELFTDGVLHQFEVPADAEVRAIPGVD